MGNIIGLAHELIHALHWADGSMTENKMINYTGLDQNTYKADADEVRTVGLNADQEGNITENSIRAEHNVDKRNNY